MADPSVIQVAPRVWRVGNLTHPSNTYICATGEGACFLVDPGTDLEAIDRTLLDLGLEPTHLFCTHGHFDHAASAAFFQGKYGASCRLHSADLKILRASNFLMMAFKVPFTMKLPRVEEADGFSARLGDEAFRVIPAPGHTPGSCLFQYGPCLFTGDTLYAQGVGLSRLPGTDHGRLKATLLALWDQLPEAALVLPGHGDCATFGAIRAGNRPLLEFLGLADQREA